MRRFFEEFLISKKKKTPQSNSEALLENLDFYFLSYLQILRTTKQFKFQCCDRYDPYRGVKPTESRHLNVSYIIHSPNWTKTRNLLMSQTNKGDVRYLLWWWAQWKFLGMAMTLSLEVSMPFLEDRLGDFDKKLLRRYSMYVWEAELILKAVFVVSNNNNCWKTFRA